MRNLFFILMILIFSMGLGINIVNAQSITSPFMPPIDDSPLDDLNNFDINDIVGNSANNALDELMGGQGNTVNDTNPTDLDSNTIVFPEIADNDTESTGSLSNTIWMWGSLLVLAAGGLYLLFRNRGY